MACRSRRSICGPTLSGDSMQLLTDNLVLRTVTEADVDEIARMWNFFDGGVTVEQAYGALTYMNANHARNAQGAFYHLCLAVCRKDAPEKILGWCGLDGKQCPHRPELYVLLHQEARGRGYGTQCAKALLSHAFNNIGLVQVHGGCDKENVASARMMEKAGMRRYANEGNGDPLFICEKE